MIQGKEDASVRTESDNRIVSKGSEEMSAIAAIDRPKRLVDELRHLLQDLSSTPPSEKYCERCGSAMTHFSAHFWLEGLRETWEIPLPYCANCNPEIGNRRSFAA